jgi:hypothetical protein
MLMGEDLPPADRSPDFGQGIAIANRHGIEVLGPPPAYTGGVEYDLNSVIRLPLSDGRSLGVWQGGVEDGEVLLFHHGTLGSYLPFRVVAGAARRLGLRLNWTEGLNSMLQDLVAAGEA